MVSPKKPWLPDFFFLFYDPWFFLPAGYALRHRSKFLESHKQQVELLRHSRGSVGKLSRERWRGGATHHFFGIFLVFFLFFLGCLNDFEGYFFLLLVLFFFFPWAFEEK